jgi:hypothetical protein
VNVTDAEKSPVFSRVELGGDKEHEKVFASPAKTVKLIHKTRIFSSSYKEGSPALTVNYAGILLNHQAGSERRVLG